MNIDFKNFFNPLVNSLKFTKQEVFLFCVVTFISIIVRGPAFFALGYQTDDYAIAGTKSWLSWNEINFLSRDGRHVAQVATIFADRLGGGGFGAVGLYPFLLNVAMILFSIGVLRLWKISRFSFTSLAVALTIVFFPYNSELFTFKYASLVYLISWFLAAFAFILESSKFSSRLIIGVLLVLSFWTFQVTAAWIAVVLIFAWMIRILPDTTEVGEDSKNLIKQDRVNLTNLTFLSAGSLCFYILLIKVLKWLFPFAHGDRTKLLEAAQISSRISEFIEWFGYLIRWDQLIPQMTRVALGTLLAFAMLGVVVTICRTRENKKRAYLIASFLLLLLLGWFASIALVLVVGTWFPAPRSTCAMGIWWAGVAFLALHFTKLGFPRFLSTLLVFFFLASFLLVSNRALFDQQRLNLRDQMLANRILARMEVQPGFDAVKRLAIIGKSNYPVRFATQKFDLNASAFDTEWSNVAILTEICGRPFQAATGEEMVRARKIAETIPEWPAPGSIMVDNDIMIIKISNIDIPSKLLYKNLKK